MTSKMVGGALAVAGAVLAVWLLFFRHHDVKPPAAPAQPKPVAPAAAPAKAAAEDPAPGGRAPQWIIDADPEGALRLEGQVIGGDGHGIAGAQVWLASVPPRSAKTEEDGSFAFDKLVGRTYTLTAADGALVGGPVTYKLTDKSDPVVISLREGASIDVTVSDEHAQPIANADVRVPDEAERPVKTDDHGKATLAGVRPGWIEVAASAPGFASSATYTSIGTAGGKGTVTLTLRKGGGVAGRIVDEAGHPLAKVKVTAGDTQNWGWHKPLDEQTTDDKGQFAFAALAPGSHTIVAVDGEHAPATSNPITVTAERAVSGVEITMKAGAIVSGVVVDRDGKPARNATVRVAGKGSGMWRVAARQATSDARGRFEVRGLARTQLQARAESDTAASGVAELDTTAKPIAKDVKLVLDVTGTISGVVVDETNQPVPEVQVNAFPDLLAGQSAETFAIAGMSSATTDGGGRFAIHGIPDGQYRLWAARHTSGIDDGWGKKSTAAKVGDTTVRIVMPAPGMVVGKLVLEDGSVPKLAYVEIGVQPASPAAQGAFKLQELAPGSYDLRVFGPEFSERIQRDVKIESGKTIDVGTLTLLRGRKLLGKVVDASGTPVAGARIKLAEALFTSGGASNESDTENWEDLSGVRTAVSDQDGAFAIQGVPAKSTSAMAEHPDRGRSTAIAIPGGTGDPPPVTLALHAYGSIVGKVVQKGQPLANVAVSEATKGSAPQASFVQTAADGTFTMPHVPEGTHVLTAMQQGMMALKSTSVTVQVTAGKPTQVTIDVPVGTIALTVQVQALPGNQVDAAQVFLANGTISVTNGKQLLDGFFQGSVQGMKFWFGEGKPQPIFDELVAGDYTVCTVPVTGDLTDAQFMQRIQENMQTLAVYCKPVKIAPSPQQQTFVDPVPAMTPLPSPKS